MNGLGNSIYERGVSQGVTQRFDLFGKLINLLLDAGRVDDAKKPLPMRWFVMNFFVSFIW